MMTGNTTVGTGNGKVNMVPLAKVSLCARRQALSSIKESRAMGVTFSIELIKHAFESTIGVSGSNVIEEPLIIQAKFGEVLLIPIGDSQFAVFSKKFFETYL